MQHATPWIAALLCLVPLTALGADGDAAPLSAETMWKIQRIGDPALSPDGRQLAYPVTWYDEDNDKGEADLYLVASSGGASRRLTSMPGKETEAAWSPDGRWIAFIAKRSDDKESQLYVMPTDGGEAIKIGDIPTGVSAPKWFPDSKRIAFISRVWPDLPEWQKAAERLKERGDSKMKAMSWGRPPIAYWDHWIDDRQAQVFSIPLEGGTPTAITLGTGFELTRQELDGHAYDISPDGSEIAFVADIDPTGIDQNFDVFVVPATGGQARNLTTDNSCDDENPRYSPDGRWLLFTRQTIKGFYGDSYQAWLVDRKSGSRRRIAADWDRSLNGMVWSPDSKALFAAIDDAGTDRVHRIDIASGRHSPVTAASSFSSLAIAGSPATLVGLRQSFSEPPTLVRIGTRDGTVTKLSAFNDTLLSGVAFGKVESVTYAGAGGDDIQMWVVYPPGFDPAKKYPLYLLLHGGPHNGIVDAWTFRWNAQVFAGWGYVVAWHNFHGSSGFGQAFTDSINPDHITKPYQDTIRAADWFAAQPWIDRDRMTAGGGSFGGFLAATLNGKPHPFKALVAHAAVYSEYAQYGADYGAGRRRFFEAWERPEEFARYSPNTYAGNFATPTLVVVGELDQRVPLNNGVEYFNTLQNRGVPSRLVYFPDENHWVLKRQNSIYWYKEVRDWLEHYAPAGTL